MSALGELIADRIRTSGPISFAEFMELALYHPELGYYARAAQRTGRAGDFFTSVDVGPIFGELLAKQFAEMWRVMEDGDARRFREQRHDPTFSISSKPAPAMAGWPVMSWTPRRAPTRDLYARIGCRSSNSLAAARAAQAATLGPHAPLLPTATRRCPAASAASFSPTSCSTRCPLTQWP